MSKTPVKDQGSNGTVADQVAEFIGRTMGELLNKKDALSKQMADVDNQIADIRKRVVSQFGALVPPPSRAKRAVKARREEGPRRRGRCARGFGRDAKQDGRSGTPPLGQGAQQEALSRHCAERPARDGRRPFRPDSAASHQHHQRGREDQRHDNRPEATQPVRKEEEHATDEARLMPACRWACRSAAINSPEDDVWTLSGQLNRGRLSWRKWCALHDSNVRPPGS